MNVVWHGHYLTYFEEARRAFGRRFELDYPVFLQHQVHAPLVKTHVEYLAPARLNDTLRVSARLLDCDGAKLEFEYLVVHDGENRSLARGSSTQVFTSLGGELLLTPPPFMIQRYENWKDQWVTP